MITLSVNGFDWDGGNRAKCQKHGVSIAAIEALFRENPRIAPDPKHSREEDRLIAIGRTSAGRPLFVVCYPADERRPPFDPPGDGPLHAREGDCRL